MKVNFSCFGILCGILLGCLQTVCGADFRKGEIRWDPEIRQIGIFVCHAAFSWELVEHELKELEVLQNQIQQKLHLPSGKEKVDVFIFQSLEEWVQFHQKRFPGTEFRRALFINPETIIKNEKNRCQIFVARSPEFVIDLRHEATHAFLHTVLGKALPIWIDEGLAEYFEQDIPQIENKEKMKFAQDRLLSGECTPIKKMERLGGMSSMGAEEYCDAWAWTFYLLDGPQDVRHILPEFLRDFSGKFFYPSISSRLGKIHRKPDELLQAYFSKLAGLRE